jgi:hypothetical protein
VSTNRLPLASFNTPTLAAGDFWSLRCDATGAVVTTSAGGGTTPSDAFANPTTAQTGWSLLGGFNGTTWDRMRSGQLGAISAATAALVLNTLPIGRYNSAAITMTDATARELQMTQEAWLRTCEQQAPQYEDNTNAVAATHWKPLAVNTYAPSLLTDFGATVTKNVKATPGNLFSFVCHNLNAAVRYIQFHNTATTPGGAAVPLLTFPVGVGAVLTLGPEFFTANGLYFSTGIAYAFSTTEGTYTAGAAGDQFTQVVYK